MLSVTMKEGQRITIGDEVEIFFSRTGTSGARISIKAPKHLRIDRWLGTECIAPKKGEQPCKTS